MKLSIVCVTNGEPYSPQFILRMHRLATILKAEFVLGLDGECAQESTLKLYADRVVNVKSKGYLESVLDDVLFVCEGDYILRLDDDERVSPVLEKWLRREEYTSNDVWCFPRVYLYKDERHFLPDLFPDLQTRLTTKDKAGGRTSIHAGSPFGTGQTAPFAIEHHKLLVKSFEQRMEIAERYERVRKGAGMSTDYGRYNLPELFQDSLTVEDYTDGDYSSL